MKPQLYPVYVPSKGRSALSNKTLGLLADAGIVANVIVEPQEVKSYEFQRGADHRIVSLPEDNRGLAYSRNQILRWSRSIDHPPRNFLSKDFGSTWIWMLDDDISAFYKIIDRRCVKVSAKDVLIAAQQMAGHNVGQVALEYQQFAWSAKDPWKKDSYCDVAVCINTLAGTSATPTYDPEVELKEDRDLTMQFIAAGMSTVRVTRFAFAAPKNGSNDGGLRGLYQTPGRERQAVDALVRKWPWCVSAQTKRDGRYDAKIAWSKIRRT